MPKKLSVFFKYLFYFTMNSTYKFKIDPNTYYKIIYYMLKTNKCTKLLNK